MNDSNNISSDSPLLIPEINDLINNNSKNLIVLNLIRKNDKINSK